MHGHENLWALLLFLARRLVFLFPWKFWVSNFDGNGRFPTAVTVRDMHGRGRDGPKAAAGEAPADWGQSGAPGRRVNVRQITTLHRHRRPRGYIHIIYVLYFIIHYII